MTLELMRTEHAAGRAHLTGTPCGGKLLGGFGCLRFQLLGRLAVPQIGVKPAVLD
jgi:hypothetical protein